MKKLYGVIGDPIAQSMSPIMHNDLFRHYGFDAHYHAFAIKEKDLENAVKGFKAIGLAGFNVTIPHKRGIMPFLDRIDSLAEAIGAVNTVVNVDGELVGYNTDGSGFVQGLKSELASITNKKVLIIGAGGAARAIYFSLAREGIAKIDLTNRTLEKTEQLAKECPYDVTSSILSLKDAEVNLGSYDIIVQTTSIGMAPHIEYEPLSVHNVKENSFVSDIIYNPLETKFLMAAKEKKAITQNGIAMFVHQGALAFEKWTGIEPDITRMESIVRKQLGGTTC